MSIVTVHILTENSRFMRYTQKKKGGKKSGLRKKEQGKICG